MISTRRGWVLSLFLLAIRDFSAFKLTSFPISCALIKSATISAHVLSSSSC